MIEYVRKADILPGLKIDRTDDDYETAKELVDQLPTFRMDGVAPVVHGRWEKSRCMAYFVICSACRSEASVHWHYCPHCGAKMDLEA